MANSPWASTDEAQAARSASIARRQRLHQRSPAPRVHHRPSSLTARAAAPLLPQPALAAVLRDLPGEVAERILVPPVPAPTGRR